MNVKLFEVRDRATCIIVMAIKLGARSEQERWMLSHSGYGRTNEDIESYIMLGSMVGGIEKMTTDPYKQSCRELREVHLLLDSNFDSMESGEVIDLEYLRGEKKEPTKSDRFYDWNAKY